MCGCGSLEEVGKSIHSCGCFQRFPGGESHSLPRVPRTQVGATIWQLCRSPLSHVDRNRSARGGVRGPEAAVQSPCWHPVTCNLTRPVTCGMTRPVTCGLTRPVTCDLTRPMTCGLTRPVTCDLTRSLTCNLTRSVTCDLNRPVTCGLTRPVTCGLTRPVTCNLTRPVTCDLTRPMTCNLTRSVTCGLTRSVTCGLTRPSDVELGDPSVAPDAASTPSDTGLGQSPNAGTGFWCPYLTICDRPRAHGRPWLAGRLPGSGPCRPWKSP